VTNFEKKVAPPPKLTRRQLSALQNPHWTKAAVGENGTPNLASCLSVFFTGTPLEEKKKEKKKQPHYLSDSDSDSGAVPRSKKKKPSASEVKVEKEVKLKPKPPIPLYAESLAAIKDAIGPMADVKDLKGFENMRVVRAYYPEGPSGTVKAEEKTEAVVVVKKELAPSSSSSSSSSNVPAISAVIDMTNDDYDYDQENTVTEKSTGGTTAVDGSSTAVAAAAAAAATTTTTTTTTTITNAAPAAASAPMAPLHFIKLPHPARSLPWLKGRIEQGETFAKYYNMLQSESPHQGPGPELGCTLLLVPMGTAAWGEARPQLFMKHLKDMLQLYVFPVKVVLAPTLSNAKVSTRRKNEHGHMQYERFEAEQVLYEGTHLSRAQYRVGVMLDELFVEDFTVPVEGEPVQSVDGHFTEDRQLSVVSFARLSSLFVDKGMSASAAFSSQELTPELTSAWLAASLRSLHHSVAHLFGLGHCSYYICMMNGYSIDGDCVVKGTGDEHVRKGSDGHLCCVCLRKFTHAISQAQRHAVHVESRYDSILQKWAQIRGDIGGVSEGVGSEMKWLKMRVESLKLSVCQPVGSSFDS